MYRQMVNLQMDYNKDMLAARCRNKANNEPNVRSEDCPVGICVCPFGDVPCEEITNEHWASIIKMEEVPFKKGELVAVKDTSDKNWSIRVFHSYNEYGHTFNYRVYEHINDLNDGECINFEQCEKLSEFSKKFFFE